MKHLNETAQEIFDTLIEGLDLVENHHKRIDNASGSFMPLSVELIAKNSIGLTYSLAHYYIQNGDLMQDPEMLFIKHENGKTFPAMFQQAAPPIYEESIFWNKKWKVNPCLQAEHTAFAHTWLKNIKNQQKL